VVLSLIGRQDEKSEVKMFTKNPIFRQSFALLMGNPESDDLYINVYDAGPEQDNTKMKMIGNLKIIVSRLLRRSNMEYLSQPFKLNNSGLESTITLSMRLVFMKACDDVKLFSNKNTPMELSINQVADCQKYEAPNDISINDNDDAGNLKRVLSITDKSNKVPKSISFDNFNDNTLQVEPNLGLTLMYTKN
jgi:hypothetical protein